MQAMVVLSVHKVKVSSEGREGLSHMNTQD